MRRQRGIDFGEWAGVYFMKKLKRGVRVAIGYYKNTSGKEEELCMIYYETTEGKVIISEVEYLEQIIPNLLILSVIFALFIEFFLGLERVVYFPTLYLPPFIMASLDHVSRYSGEYKIYYPK